MTFYKFTDTRGLDILKNRELLNSKPSSFNDPFEFVPVVSGYDVEKDIEVRLSNPIFLQSLMRNEIQQGRFKGSLAEFPGFLQRNLESYKMNMRRSLSQAIVNTAARMQELADRITGLVSLTIIPNHPLMWAHYGESHRGLMYEFDFAFLRDRRPVRVMYSEKRPTSDFQYSVQESIIEKEMQRLMITKSSAWTYEEEYRLFFEPGECRQKKCQGGIERNFFPIPGGAIRRVVIGLRASAGLLGEVKNLLRSEDLEHVVLEKAYIDDEEYKILTTEQW